MSVPPPFITMAPSTELTVAEPAIPGPPMSTSVSETEPLDRDVMLKLFTTARVLDVLPLEAKRPMLSAALIEVHVTPVLGLVTSVKLVPSLDT